MPQSNKFLRRGLGQSDWKWNLILALLSPHTLETSPRSALYFIGETGKCFQYKYEQINLRRN